MYECLNCLHQSKKGKQKKKTLQTEFNDNLEFGTEKKYFFQMNDLSMHQFLCTIG